MNEMAIKATITAEKPMSPTSSWFSDFLAAKRITYVGIEMENSKTCVV